MEGVWRPLARELPLIREAKPPHHFNRTDASRSRLRSILTSQGSNKLAAALDDLARERLAPGLAGRQISMQSGTQILVCRILAR